MQIPKLLNSRVLGCALTGLGLCLMTGNARAGTFGPADFSSQPAGLNIYGNATVDSGFLKLTPNSGSQNGGMWIDDLDPMATVAGFDCTFKLYIGSGNGADGFSFYFGDFADNTATGEEGPGTFKGLSVCFDVYNSGAAAPLNEAPAIDVKWDNVVVFHRLVGATVANSQASPLGTATTIRTQPTQNGAPVWWPVKIHVDPDGTLDIAYNNVVVCTNFPIFRAKDPNIEVPTYGSGYRFGMGARTGGSFDAHWVDDLAITTYAPDATTGQPYITAINPVPVGANAGAAGGISVNLADSTNSINLSKVTMKLGNNTVTPTVVRIDPNTTRIAYFGPAGGAIPSGLTTVNVAYETTSTPPLVNNFSWTFFVDPYSTTPGTFAVESVDTSKPGFKYRLYQMDSIRGPGNNQNKTVLAERQLAFGYSDPITGLPFPNTADLSTAEPDGTFIEPGVINFNYRAGTTEIGGFQSGSTPSRPDKLFPGIPGSAAVANEGNFVVEFDTFLQLKAGAQRLGVNSDDGFRVSLAPGFDAPAPVIAGQFDGGRGSADTMVDVVVPADGYYPVRVSYWQGGGDANIEFFWVDPATGAKVLVNDPDNLNAPRAYRESAVSRPSITRALPVQNWLVAFPDEDVIIDITDGVLALSGTPSLYINGAAQTVNVAKVGKVTTVKRPGSVSSLLPSGLNNVQLVYGYDQNGTPVSLTNNYSFTVAPYYGVVPAANKVASASDAGFRIRVNQMDKSGDANQGNGARIHGGSDANRMPFPEIQLAGGMINPTNGLPYPNLAQPGVNNDFMFDSDVVNWQYNAADHTIAQSGWFRDNSPAYPFVGSRADIGVPGFWGTGSSYGGLENGVLEIMTYLDLPAGITMLGFNSDDGFIAISAPDVHDTLGTLLGFDSRGKGNTDTIIGPTGGNPPVVTPYLSAGSTFFSVIVPEAGIYPFRILFWQGGTGFNAEFFSINRTNGSFVLVGDEANGGIPAYKTYSGPARPYVKFSVCPTPWDNSYQQSGPGPIKMVGRTRGNVGANDIYNIANRDWSRPWADVPIGGVVANGAADAANIKLLLNGVEVPATKTPAGTDLVVSYQPNPPLPSGSTNTASLVYAGTTNSWTFPVLGWTTLNESDALPLTAAKQDAVGFRVKMTQVASVGSYAQSSVARAEAQLAGILGPDLAFPGPGPGGSYIYPGLINWNSNFQTNLTGLTPTPLGNFQGANYYGAGTGWPFPNYADEPFPGIPGSGRSNLDNSAAEVFAYLALPAAGAYHFGVNSDDGFGVKVGTPGVTNGTAIVAGFNAGKGSSDIPFMFVAPKAGLYPIRLIYYNSGSGAALEYFSYDANGNKIAINDPNNTAAIKAYYDVVATEAPVITQYSIAGGNITITWTGGGTLEWADAVNAASWTSTSNSTGTFTEPVAAGNRFYRVKR